MRAMILAAGGGTRLHPLTLSMPKPMAPVVNRPVMAYIVQVLVRNGIQDLVVNLSYLPDQIRDYFGDGRALGASITYSMESEAMGTAGGVKRVEDHLRDGTFLVIGGDDLTDVDLTPLLAFHRDRGALATIGLSTVEDPSQYGVVQTDAQGRILRFQEKPSRAEAVSTQVNNGIYIFEPAILDQIPPDTFYDFGKQLFPKLLEIGAPFYGCPTDAYWCDIGTITEYRQAHWDVLEGRVRVSLPGRITRPGLWVEEGVRVDPEAVIEGPVAVGRGAVVEGGARLSGPVSIGAGCLLSKNSRVERSILWGGVHVGPGARVMGSVLGTGCRVASGCQVTDSVFQADQSITESLAGVTV